MHNGYLMSEGEKMSKSLGNFYTVHELLEEFPGEAIRLLLLQTHYRQPLDFTKAGIAEARRTMDRWHRAADGVDPDGPVAQTVMDALADDLNTPKAIAELHQLSTSDPVGFLASARLMGLFGQSAEDWLKWQPPKSAGGLDDVAIDALIKERVQARQNKDFATSDRIRDDLAAQGILLEDGPAGTTWRSG
jgi:cysteinyl-tRNA synthetase